MVLTSRTTASSTGWETDSLSMPALALLSAPLDDERKDKRARSAGRKYKRKKLLQHDVSIPLAQCSFFFFLSFCFAGNNNNKFGLCVYFSPNSTKNNKNRFWINFAFFRFLPLFISLVSVLAADCFLLDHHGCQLPKIPAGFQCNFTTTVCYGWRSLCNVSPPEYDFFSIVWKNVILIPFCLWPISGDCIAQQVIEKKGNRHDFIRTARLTAYGCVKSLYCLFLIFSSNSHLPMTPLSLVEASFSHQSWLSGLERF